MTRASELVYHPVNPSFGGNPFNSDHLLGVANAQNDFDPPARSSLTGLGTDPADQFVRQLQSRLLSALANQVTDALFGANKEDHGTITFGDQTVEFNRNNETIELTIINNLTGARTQVSVPNLVTSNTTTTSPTTTSPTTTSPIP